MRIRPLLTAEGERNESTPSLSYTCASSSTSDAGQASGAQGSVVRVTKGQTCFQGDFDAVLPPQSSQARVYEEVRECIAHVLAGKNACIFAYGQVLLHQFTCFIGTKVLHI